MAVSGGNLYISALGVFFLGTISEMVKEIIS